MATKKQSRSLSRAIARSSPSAEGMPLGEMTEPLGEGLRSMPIEGEAHGFGMTSEQSVDVVVTGRMPGEGGATSAGVGDGDGEMPGRGMSPT